MPKSPPPENPGGPQDFSADHGVVQVSAPQTRVVVAGLALIGVLYLAGVPLWTALGTVIAGVAGLVMAVQVPREVVELVKLLREVRRLSVERGR